MSRRPPLHVALAGWNTAPALGLDPKGPIGGLETFTCQLASALAQCPDRRVSLLLRHTRPLSIATWHGVRLETLVERLRDVRLAVSRSIEKHAEFPWIRVTHWRAGLVWRLPLLVASKILHRGAGPHARLRRHCERISPDAWVAFGCSTESAIMVRLASQTGTPSILWLQSNADLDPRFFRDEPFVNEYGVKGVDARDAIRQATVVVCQTEWQRAHLEPFRNGPAVVIRNPIQFDQWRGASIDDSRRTHVLWIGRYDRFHKNPLRCLDVARRLPEIPFVMIINQGDGDVKSDVRRTKPANVQLVDRVPHSEMPDQFSQARLFLSTGSPEHEGFPNVLLEAAAAGVPIVSWDDFDNFLGRSGAGCSGAGDIDQLVRGLRQLWSDPVAWETASTRGIKYVQREHDPDVILADFNLVLDRFAHVLPGQSLDSTVRR